jgi:putative ABC transport system substrate-binding protein
MRRREFITLLGGAAVAWSRGARAQQAIPVVGFLLSAAFPEQNVRLAAFRAGLSEMGYVDGRSVVIEYQRAEDYNRLSDLALALVRRQVAVIVTVGTPAALAAKAATTTIPIVFGIGRDPIAIGLVTGLNRPGGNMTGVVVLSSELAAKRLQLLRELVPAIPVVGLLVNPANPAYTDAEFREMKVAARSLGLQLEVLRASTPSEIEAAFGQIVQLRVGALVISQELFFASQRDQIVTLAARYAVPTIYGTREDALAGGLMSYGADIADSYRQVGIYVGRIFKGEKPADLPVQQASKIDLIINLKTARALGLTFPITLLGRANEVIE